MSALRIETMREGFRKAWLPDGDALHIITTPDGEEYHSHPGEIAIEVLSGWYREERLFTNGGGYQRRVIAGDEFTIYPGDIHRITEVSPGGCLTLCTYGPHERETRFYRLRDGEVQSRAWNEEWAA